MAIGGRPHLFHTPACRHVRANHFHISASYRGWDNARNLVTAKKPSPAEMPCVSQNMRAGEISKPKPTDRWPGKRHQHTALGTYAHQHCNHGHWRAHAPAHLS